jgi:S-DNA-T family DNA segregation ATPase FtsK/SpoIIIE
MYELEPAPGVKINKITNLADDLALALMAPSIRILAPIPGKNVIGIEIPNLKRDPVFLKDVLDNDAFLESSLRLPIALGVDFVGAPVIADLTKMPHLLIAGTTGSGKSVALNAMICSILFKAKPDDIKFLMVDPKRLELSSYEGIPHLMHPVVFDPKKASQVLRWTVEEMERRYKTISDLGVKSIDAYNEALLKGSKDHAVSVIKENTAEIQLDDEFKASEMASPRHDQPIKHVKLPYIIVVIDELADLMMVASRDVEESLTRLAQMARAAGIHLIIATQRPSVDVITGLIKATFPRVSLFRCLRKLIPARSSINRERNNCLETEICCLFRRVLPNSRVSTELMFRIKKFPALLILSKCRRNRPMILPLKSMNSKHLKRSMSKTVMMKNMMKPSLWLVNLGRHPYHLSSDT